MKSLLHGYEQGHFCPRRCSANDAISNATGLLMPQYRTEYFWRSSNRQKNKKSIRTASWFSGSQLAFDTILRLVYYWCQDVEQRYAAFECAVSKDTVCDFYSYALQMCYRVLERNGSLLVYRTRPCNWILLQIFGLSECLHQSPHRSFALILLQIYSMR